MQEYNSLEYVTLSESELEKIHGGLITCGLLKAIVKIGAGLALGYLAHEAMT
jgi:lactobin A/cerein 7B family class IIb bacteriocin